MWNAINRFQQQREEDLKNISTISNFFAAHEIRLYSNRKKGKGKGYGEGCEII